MKPYNDNLCLFCALALRSHGNERLEEETSKLFKLLMSSMNRLSFSQFEGAHMNDIPFGEGLLLLNILFYDLDIVEGNFIYELVRRNMQKHENTVRLLRYNILRYYVSIVGAVFQTFRCPNCDTFVNRTSNLERNLTNWGERVKHVYPKNGHQISKLLFDKLDSFNIKYMSERKLLQKLTISDFESICVQKETFRDSKTTKWLGKHGPISLSVLSNLVEGPIFLCNTDPQHLVATLIGALEKLSCQSNAKMKNLFLDIKTAIKIKLGCIMEKFTQRHNRREQLKRFDMNQDDCENENCGSTQFLQFLFFFKKHDSENEKKFSSSDFDFTTTRLILNWKKTQRVSFRIRKYTTCRILSKVSTRQFWKQKHFYFFNLNLTTWSFHIVLHKTTMYSYSPQYLRQLVNSICCRSFNTSFTLFRKDLGFDFAMVCNFNLCLGLIYAEVCCY